MNIIEEAVKHYGINNQLSKLVEECCELAVEITHYKDNRSDVQRVCSEIADVKILLQQMEVIWSVGIETQYKLKLERLRKRIEEAQKDGGAY